MKEIINGIIRQLHVRNQTFPKLNVFLYCTKVSVGNTSKLHCQWVVPDYITIVSRQHHSYKIRNCAHSKKVESLLSAHCLKPYHYPINKPTKHIHNMLMTTLNWFLMKFTRTQTDLLIRKLITLHLWCLVKQTTHQ